MSDWTTTVPNSVRNSAPVGQTSRQPAWVQCLQTSEDISQRNSSRSSTPDPSPGLENDGIPRSTVDGPATGAGSSVDGAGDDVAGCSMKATCRQVDAPSAPVLS